MAEETPQPMPQPEATDETIAQIDRLLVDLLDTYTANGDDRLAMAVAVLSWLFTNIVHTRTIDFTKDNAQSQKQVSDGLCDILKADALTNLLQDIKSRKGGGDGDGQ